ncbi:MAG: UDP-N-acetylmuramoyl-tripeptide--D-alanyl-D-alanine ligase [Candidatus Aminicenantia bacterium]
MTELSLIQIAQITGGEFIQGEPFLTFNQYNIDSRLTKNGELFFAIVAKRDGHIFVEHAFKKGAKGAVISKRIPIEDKNKGLILVSDTLIALQELAKKVASEHNIKVIGITGGIGKTTAKEFAAALIEPSFKTLKSEKNFNNYLGLPLTLLKLQKEHQVVILEMGMSSRGEIRRLTEIAPPDISVITNINPVHLEFFKDINEIALAKKEILDGTKKDGVAVLNADDPLIMKIQSDFPGNKIYFGLREKAFIRAANIELKGFSGLSFDLIYGEEKKRILFKALSHSHLYDLLAALGVTYALNIKLKDIEEIIPTLHPFSMRGTVLALEKNVTLIDDSYNSNPKALEFALRDYSSLPVRRKIAVLGDMLELGKNSSKFHFQAGEKVSEYGYDWLIAIGEESKKMIEGALSKGMNSSHLLHFKDSVQAAEYLVNFVQEGDLILVKGSRGIQTEKIIFKLKEEFSKR